MRRIIKTAFYFILILLISGNIIGQTIISLKNPGDVWMYHKNPVWVGDEFIIEVHLHSGNQKLAAYGFYLPYDNSLIEANFSLGNAGVLAGPDGFVTATPIDPGVVIASGFDAIGTGPREDLYILNIHFTAVSPGTTPLELVINKLTSPEIEIIGIPNGINSSITILPAKESGNAWLEHPYKVNYGMRLKAELHFNSGWQKLSAFGIPIQYDPSMLNVDTAIGTGGIEPGPDGFITAASPAEGMVLVSGYDASGNGPGEDLHIATVNFRAIQTGSTFLNSTINNASDDSGQSIGTPNSMNSSITIVNSYIRGDVNYDWSIDIVDALFAAQYYVGFIPLIDIYAADVNGDGEVNIIDALLIAQFYVEVITEFPADLNTPPVAHDDSVATVQNESVIINVLFNDTDVDGDILSIDSVSPPLNGTVIIEGDAIRYTPDTFFNGADSFTYTVSDGRGGFDTATVTVTSTGPCCPDYRAVDDNAETDEDSPVLIDVLSNDTDVPPYLDYLNIYSVSTPQNGTAEIIDNQILYMPDANFYGLDTFQYKGSDMILTGTATVIVTIHPVNDPPVAADDSVTTNEDTSVTICVLANDTDVDGDTLAISTVGPPLNGVATIVAGQIYYAPDANFSGIDSFSYTISDGHGGIDIGLVTVDVSPLCCGGPDSYDDTAVTYENTPVLIDVLANDTDIDGDVIFIVSVGLPANGSAVVTGNLIEYTPDTNFFGVDSFTYVAGDGSGGTDTAIVTITINK